MVVCRFFQQGRCRNGDACKFEHPGSDRRESYNNPPPPSSNRFGALSEVGNNRPNTQNAFNQGNARNPVNPGNNRNPPNTGQGQTGHNRNDRNSGNINATNNGENRNPAFRHPTGIPLPYLITKDGIIADLDTQREKPQWPFSAYGPGRDAPRQLFGGYPIEQSPEELRVMYYLAAASGSTLSAENAERNLLVEADQQVRRILNDLDGAINYVIDGQNQHPNRLDMCTAGQFETNRPSGVFRKPSESDRVWPSAAPSFGRPSAFGQVGQGSGGFGKPSSFGQAAQGGSGFGQPSASGQGSTFGQPSAPGGAFGRPSAPAGAFERPNAPSSAFGQPSAPGAAFGKPNVFGQPSAPVGVFGQPSAPAVNAPAAGGFGQPSAPAGGFVQPSASPFAVSALPNPTTTFGQPSAPTNPFNQGGTHQPSAPPPSSFFGQAAAAKVPAFSPFAPSGGARANPSPFAPAPAGVTPSPFAATISNPSATGAAPTPSAAPASNPAAWNPAQNSDLANDTWIAAHYEDNSSGDDGLPNPASYITRHANNSLQAWKKHPVRYQAQIPYFVAKSGELERIFHPDGPPSLREGPDTEDPPEVYEGNDALRDAYRFVRTNYAFMGGVMPDEPPKAEWIRWDV